MAVEQANVALQQAALTELANGSRPEEIATAEAQYEQTKNDTERLKFEYDREKKLFDLGITSKSDWQVTEYAYLVSLQKERQLENQYILVKKGPRQEEIDQGRARFEQAKQSLAVAQSSLDYATLSCPVGGVVLSKNVEAGEYVSPGTPVVTVADIENLYLRAYINETDLGRVKLGQRARVTTDTYPGKLYEGVVAFISDQAEFTPKNVQTTEERVKLVYRIKVNIHNPNLELKPGMPADADIDLQ